MIYSLLEVFKVLLATHALLHVLVLLVCNGVFMYTSLVFHTARLHTLNDSKRLCQVSMLRRIAAVFALQE